jgi:cytochrome c-type biogenesis protein CcmH/NrfF
MVDFSCGYWPEHHASMVQHATAGMTAEEIIQAYVTEHGEEFLMMTPEGFNLVGYVLPGALIAAGGTLLAMFLHRAHKVAAVASAASGVEVDVGLSEDEKRLLEDELHDLEV